MDLSRPFGDSVNDYISRQDYTLKFCSVDDAVKILTRLGPGALMAKVDLKHAFRLIPVHPADWHLLGYQFDNLYYFDIVLPFGLRSSPAIFNRLSDFLEWIVRHVANFADVLHYVDDFFFAGPANSRLCQLVMEFFFLLCGDLGVPIALDKCDGPSTTITFLGVQIDTVTQTLSLPEEKLRDLLSEFQVFSNAKSMTKRDLLSLIGKLSWATKIIPAGRIFLRRMINLANSVRQLHYRISLNKEFRADLNWWLEFLPLWNGFYSFLEPTWTSSADLNLFTDASLTFGCGAVYGHEWLQYEWPSELSSLKPHITWCEMFPVLLACHVWGHRWRTLRLTFYSDNSAVVSTWKSFSSRHCGVMDLIRRIYFTAARHNFHVRIVHIPGKDNLAADALSRNRLDLFRQLVPEADIAPQPVNYDVSLLLHALTAGQERTKKADQMRAASGFRDGQTLQRPPVIE
ncbi:uncharacterized protein LOC129598954 [Paramacrobiotus metropolitanus]|uniref:uncharacterized protein LOC129598954 n=1 Tax=Paramacrobiotus metropolitanus TaxID=2943436 RepID=UPI0024460DB1|nr:uncharacterized protein LOC129598954 [Paramacrobiotus metropolitanus]